MSWLRTELRSALRKWRNDWRVACVIVLPLAATVGFNVAIFSFAKGLVLDPLPAIRDADRLFALQNEVVGGQGSSHLSYPEFEAYKASLGSFSRWNAAYTLGATLTEPPARRVVGQLVTSDFFGTLGVEPALGRFFLPEEGAFPDGLPVAVISHALWQERYQGDPNILGREIEAERRTLTVIGVAQRGFSGLQALLAVDLWVPLGMAPAFGVEIDDLQRRDLASLDVYGRLAPGRELPVARAELEAAGEALRSAHPDMHSRHRPVLRGVLEQTLPPRFAGMVETSAIAALTLAGLLLMVAGLNLSQLVSLRNQARARDTETRMALGAGRLHLLGSLGAETFLLALFAVLPGAWLGTQMRNLLWACRPEFLGKEGLALQADGWTLLFVAALIPVVALLLAAVGLPPLARRGGGGNAGLPLGRGRLLAGSARRSWRWSEVAIGLEVAFCIVAILAGFLYLRHLSTSLHPELSFDARHLITVRLVPPSHLSPSDVERLQDEALGRLAGVPGIRQAALAESHVLGGFRFWMRAYRGSEDKVLAELPQVGSSWVGPGYFATAGIPVLRGRGFTEGDFRPESRAAVVSRSLADQLFAGREAVGHPIWVEDGEALEVVGVVEDVPALSAGDTSRPFLYEPRGRRFTPWFALQARAGEAPEDLLPGVQRTLSSLEPGLLVQAHTIDGLLKRSLWLPRAILFLLTLLSGLAVALAATGLAAITAQSLVLRRKEIAVRLALGARRSQLLWPSLRRALVLVAAGSLAGGLLGSRVDLWLSESLEISGRFHLSSYLLAVTALTLILILSTAIPALLQTRHDPAPTLREETV